MNTIDVEEWAEGGDPIRKPWGLVLLLALKDRANRVSYDPARGEHALTYEIDGVEYAMVPPPDVMAMAMEKVVREVLVHPSVWTHMFGRWIKAPTTSGAFFAKTNGTSAKVEAITDRGKATVNLYFKPNSNTAPIAKAALDAIRAKLSETSSL